MNLGNLPALFILCEVDALDDIAVPQPDFAAGAESEELLGGIFHEIIPLDEHLPGKRDLPGSHGRVLGGDRGLRIPPSALRDNCR